MERVKYMTPEEKKLEEDKLRKEIKELQVQLKSVYGDLLQVFLLEMYHFRCHKACHKCEYQNCSYHLPFYYCCRNRSHGLRNEVMQPF